MPLSAPTSLTVVESTSNPGVATLSITNGNTDPVKALVERSTSATGPFTTIIIEPSSGTSTATSFSLNDTPGTSQTFYYRVRFADDNLTEFSPYSSTVSVAMGTGQLFPTVLQVLFTISPCNEYIQVQELTGRRTADVNGYQETVDISDYSVNMDLIDSTGASVGTFTTTPTDQKTIKQVALSAFGTIPEGIYTVKYEVFDDTSTSIGFVEGYVIYSPTLTKGIKNKALELADDCGRHDAKFCNVVLIYDSVIPMLIKEGNLARANELFAIILADATPWI